MSAYDVGRLSVCEYLLPVCTPFASRVNLLPLYSEAHKDISELEHSSRSRGLVSNVGVTAP